MRSIHRKRFSRAKTPILYNTIRILNLNMSLMSEWERGFVMNITKRLSNKERLSQKQVKTIVKIYKNF